MKFFHFVSANTFNSKSLQDIETFVNTFPDFQTVAVDDEEELCLLLKHMGISMPATIQVDGGDYKKYWDISDMYLPEYNEEEFDIFYKEWVNVSNKENNMNQYGSLIFLNGLSLKWNQMKYRLIVMEK